MRTTKTTTGDDDDDEGTVDIEKILSRLSFIYFDVRTTKTTTGDDDDDEGTDTADLQESTDTADLQESTDLEKISSRWSFIYLEDFVVLYILTTTTRPNEEDVDRRRRSCAECRTSCKSSALVAIETGKCQVEGLQIL